MKALAFLRHNLDVVLILGFIAYLILGAAFGIGRYVDGYTYSLVDYLKGVLILVAFFGIGIYVGRKWERK